MLVYIIITIFGRIYGYDFELSVVTVGNIILFIISLHFEKMVCSNIANQATADYQVYRLSVIAVVYVCTLNLHVCILYCFVVCL